MKHLRLLSPLFVLALASAACGGGTTPPAATPGHEAHEHGPGGHEHHGEGHGHHGKEHDEHQGLPAPVKDLHETLAPVWHMAKGPERAAKTCEKALAMHDKSVVIQNAPKPEHAKEAEWKAAVGELVASGKALVTECEKEGRPALDERFTAFHERFHKVVEQLEHEHH